MKVECQPTRKQVASEFRKVHITQNEQFFNAILHFISCMKSVIRG